MKAFLTFLLAAAASATVAAQSAPAAPAKAAEKAQSAPAGKAPAKAAEKSAKKSSSKLAPGARKAVEENTAIDEDTSTQLTPAELQTARSVYVGEMKCELGTIVRVTPMRREGFFMISTNKGQRFRMHPHESRTGAIRLEDPRRGAMWLQLGNKSMLMSQKLGQRLADECQGPEQVTYAEALKKNPLPSILEPHAHHGHGRMHGHMQGQGNAQGQADQPAAAPQPTSETVTYPAGPAR